uniref:Uncharacterized protein n=1 Tax=Ciona intestinalis TaxID=7719 RepID=H2XML1_CIOIN
MTLFKTIIWKNVEGILPTYIVMERFCFRTVFTCI